MQPVSPAFGSPDCCSAVHQPHAPSAEDSPQNLHAGNVSKAVQVCTQPELGQLLPVGHCDSHKAALPYWSPAVYLLCKHTHPSVCLQGNALGKNQSCRTIVQQRGQRLLQMMKAIPQLQQDNKSADALLLGCCKSELAAMMEKQSHKNCFTSIVRYCCDNISAMLARLTQSRYQVDDVIFAESRMTGFP